MGKEGANMPESLSCNSLKRPHSANFETEASAGPLLTYRPKPSFGVDISSASLSFSSCSSAMTSSLGYGSRNGSFSSSPPSKASGQSFISSPLSGSGGKSSNSSPSTSLSPKGSISVGGSCDRENLVLCPNQGGPASKPLSEVVVRQSKLDRERVSSWAQFLDNSMEAHDESVEKRHMVDISELFLGQKFACGTFSRLYRGQYREQEVAVKMVRQPDDDVEIANRLERQFGQELSLLSRLHHVNIVQFVGAIRKPPIFCIITEYLSGGSLRAFLHKNESQALGMDRVLALAIDVARGMEYLHSQGVLHLDLKSHNLVLGDNCRVKVTDFGVARLQSECASMTPDAGTYRWMAPEMISSKITSTKADVYSFGIIFWEILTGQTPYEDMSTVQAAFAVVHKNVRPLIPDNCPRPLKQLMEECWSAHPEKRPNFWQIVQRLEEFQDCYHRNCTVSWQFDCEKRNWLWPVLQKFKPVCFASP